jgi:hypothetical protein
MALMVNLCLRTVAAINSSNSNPNNNKANSSLVNTRHHHKATISHPACMGNLNLAKCHNSRLLENLAVSVPMMNRIRLPWCHLTLRHKVLVVQVMHLATHTLILQA